MQIRRLEWVGLCLGLAVGATLPPATLHGDPARLLATFLGLISASILPSISLVLGSMTTGGRSVAAINRLEHELRSAVDALFILLVLVGVIFVSLFMLDLPAPKFFEKLPYLTTDILPRFGQGVVTSGTVLILLRAGQIPAILRRSLTIRHEIAVDEAKKKTIENASKIPEAKALFGRDPNFGKTVTLEDVRRPQ